MCLWGRRHSATRSLSDRVGPRQTKPRSCWQNDCSQLALAVEAQALASSRRVLPRSGRPLPPLGLAPLGTVARLAVEGDDAPEPETLVTEPCLRSFIDSRRPKPGKPHEARRLL